jgi:hypothetical protein
LDDQRNGSLKEFSKLLARHLANVWSVAYSAFTGAVAFLQAQLQPEWLGFLGSWWTTVVVFFSAAFVYVGFRIYSETVRDYEARIARIHSTQPQLEIGFNHRGELVRDLEASVRPVETVPPQEQYMRQQKSRLAKQFDLAESRIAEHEREHPFSGFTFPRKSLLDKEAFKEGVDRFVVSWGKYLNEMRTYLIGRHCTCAISPIVSNVGPVTAKFLTVEITLPQEVRSALDTEIEAFDDDVGDLRPERPTDPNAIECSISIPPLDPMLNYLPQYPPQYPEPSEPRRPRIVSDGKAVRVHYEIPSITAGRSEDRLPPFHIVIENLRESRSLDFRVNIFADALNSPIEETLTLRVEVGNTVAIE